ncbi:hypothetical protein RKD39_004101 [Streptomyces albogriseolus]
MDELGDDPARHVVDGERLLRVLLRDPRVEDDLEQHVPQLLPQLVPVAVLDGLDELVRLLDAVLGEPLVGLLRGPRALGADAVHDLHQVQQAGARQVVGGGQQLQLGHADPAAPGHPRQSVGERGLALAGRDDDHRAAAGAGVDDLLGGGRGLLDGYPSLPQIRQLRMGAVRAQHPVGRAQGLPGGPGQQSWRDPVAGGEQDDTAGGGLGGRCGAGCVHPSKLAHLTAPAAARPWR